MSEKTINCPFCKEPIIVDFGDDVSIYLCPGCGEQLKIAKKTRRTKKTGVVVDGQTFSMKESGHENPVASNVRLAKDDWKKEGGGMSFQDRVLQSPREAPPPAVAPMPGYPPNFPWPPGYPLPPGYAYPPAPIPGANYPVQQPYPVPQAPPANLPAAPAPAPVPPAPASQEDEEEHEDDMEFSVTALQPSPTPTTEKRTEPELTTRSLPLEGHEEEQEVELEESRHVRKAKKRTITRLIIGAVILALAVILLTVLHGTAWDLISQAPKQRSNEVIGSLGSGNAAENPPANIEIDLAKLEKLAVKRPEIPIPEGAPTLRPLPDLPSKAATRAEIAREVALSFLNATTIEERATFVRNPERATERMKNWYLRHPDGAIPFLLVEKNSVETLDPRYIAFRVVLTDEGSRFIGLEATNDGYKVDWESFVTYSDMDWDEYQRVKPVKPLEFRVFAAPADYFNNEFADRAALTCFQLLPFDQTKQALYAYTEKGSETESQMLSLLEQNQGKPIAVVLQLRFPENAKGSNQVWLDKLLSNGWMDRDSPP